MGAAPPIHELEPQGTRAHPLEEVAAALGSGGERSTARADTPDGAAAPGAAGSTVATAEAATPDRSDPNVQTLGELLQEAREARHLSIEEASARTRISTQMLRHLENDRFGELPADAYVKGFLRSYGGFLGLDVGLLLRRYETLTGRVAEPAPEIWTEEVSAPPQRWRPSRRATAAVAGLGLMAALVWVFWSQGAARLGLRPHAGLEQIENELLESRGDAGQVPAPLATASPSTLREDTSPALPESVRTLAESLAVRPDSVPAPPVVAPAAAIAAPPAAATPKRVKPVRPPGARKAKRDSLKALEDLEPVPLDDFRPERP